MNYPTQPSIEVNDNEIIWIRVMGNDIDRTIWMKNIDLFIFMFTKLKILLY